MKKHKFLVLGLLTLTTTVFFSCSDDNKEPEDNTKKPTAITLSKQEVTVEEGKTTNLAVKYEPSDATGDITWASENTAIAKVENGIVTGVKAGKTTVVASCGSLTASCEVTVTEVAIIDPGTLLNGTQYYILSMDATTFGKLGNKVVKDYRINGDYGDENATAVLEVWGDSFTGGSKSGPNSFNLLEEWMSLLSQTGEGWGLGCGGIRQRNTTVDFTGVTQDHVLVITYKANSTATSDIVEFIVYGTVGGAEYKIQCPANTKGEWVKIEKSVKELTAAGINWSQPINITADKAYYSLGLTIGGVGNQLDVDAAFIYKPAAE